MSWLPVRLFMSCFIAAVSTGVFVVVLISIAFFVVDAFRRGRFDFLNTKSGFILIFIIPFVYVFLDYFALAINKNLEFYGGGVQGAFNMLEHGLGRVFLSVGYLGFMFFIIALFLLFFAALIFYLKIRFSTVEKLFFISVLGGFFGFTVLTLAIPLALCEWVVLKHKFLGRLNRVMQN
ncbi:hypothetical protein [Metapseudomonas otitidis]|uniref:hypothetical protein n=1 Tax=Metapseudomonas otitidis TaxID=319939 RepID=UPI001602D352|nr:hypothetical protein [Pseudomonas otitidis]